MCMQTDLLAVQGCGGRPAVSCQWSRIKLLPCTDAVIYPVICWTSFSVRVAK